MYRIGFVLVLFGACGSDGEEGFDTLQACYTEHISGDEHLTHTEAIVACCLDHPIMGHTEICKSTQAECETFVNAELDDTATATDVTMGCTDYFVQKDK